MTTYIIGREPDPSRPRIVIADKSVSRSHGLISLDSNGKYRLEDTNSANGTFVREKGGWRRITVASVGAADDVRLGTYITTVAELLREAVSAPAQVRLERNPETGEIVKKAK